jgi:hypothetical protein
LPKLASSAGISLSSVVSPATISVALPGLEPLGVPLGEVVAGQRADGLRSPGGGLPYACSAPYSRPGSRRVASVFGLAFSWPSRRCGAASGQRELVGREGRIQRGVGQQRQRRRQVALVACRRTSDRSAWCHRQARAQISSASDELEGVARLRALVEHVQRQRGSAGLGRCRPRRRHRAPARRCTIGVAMALQQHHLQAVAQLRALHLRELDVGGGAQAGSTLRSSASFTAGQFGGRAHRHRVVVGAQPAWPVAFISAGVAVPSASRRFR